MLLSDPDLGMHLKKIKPAVAYLTTIFIVTLQKTLALGLTLFHFYCVHELFMLLEDRQRKVII